MRLALHQARVALFKQQQTTGHDWASLVGYVRLPEGYADHLLEIRLESAMASLKTIQGWSDSLVDHGDHDAALLEQVAKELRHRIEGLSGFLRESESTSRRGVVEENLGLLGSAEKRLAELLFAHGQLAAKSLWVQEMHQAIGRSHAWYRRAYMQNLSHHWTGVQCLSMEAALEGRIVNPHHWHAAVAAAEIDLESKHPVSVIWALGSLAELYLISPLAGQSQFANAASACLAKMKKLLRSQPDSDNFPLESTARQFKRYVNWWTSENGFFPGRPDLAAEAGILVQALRPDPVSARQLLG